MVSRAAAAGQRYVGRTDAPASCRADNAIMTDEDPEPRIMNCGTHGEDVAAVVCRHHIDTLDRVAGFVENSDDPDDLQAWCDDCEVFFLAEGDKTAAFREFNNFAVVCTQCYVLLKSRHSKS